MKKKKIIKLIMIIYTVIYVAILLGLTIDMIIVGDFDFQILIGLVLFYIVSVALVILSGIVPERHRGMSSTKYYDEYLKMNGVPPEPWIYEDLLSEKEYNEMQIHKNLAKYQGTNKNFTSMEKLINQINAYNISNFPYSKIKLIGIKSKEELRQDKKYSVEIIKRFGECIDTVNIIQIDENK